MDRYTIQVRLYTRENGTFGGTVDSAFFSPENTLEVFDDALNIEDSFRVTPLNIMIRKNGKLISYKDLLH